MNTFASLRPLVATALDLGFAGLSLFSAATPAGAGLSENRRHCAQRYGKDFMVVETDYGRSAVPDNPAMLWPQTPAGRAPFLSELVRTVRSEPNGRAILYWQPEWDRWNVDGVPGPAVAVGDSLRTP